ncbi:MAG: carboxypeptidase-like regulatory domain-containing protein, partial [Vicinamibacteraceae bacterium]
MRATRVLTVGAAVVGLVLVLTLTGMRASQSIDARMSVDGDDLGGAVTSEKGPEAGVWVIAETTDLPTKFVKIVVTDDQGRYLIPDLPKASYSVWVRGYGLVDSPKVRATPGNDLNLTAVVAPDKKAAARYYPAGYWLSLMKVPGEEEFKRESATKGGISPEVESQGEWLRMVKSGGCTACHQLGNKATREIPAQLGTFASSAAAWAQRVQSGQAGGSMVSGLQSFGAQRALAMFADWTDRIAAGELPPTPPRPQGLERHVVITQWDWADPKAYLHDEVSTDRRDPTVNANGPIYGALEVSADYLPVLDPARHTASRVPLTVRDPSTESSAPPGVAQPSPYWGEEAIWTSKNNVHTPMLDEHGRVWITSTVRPPENPDFCKEGSSHPSAKLFPIERASRHLAVYDPKTKKLTHISTCFGTHHLMFAEDANDTLWTSGGGQVVGWLNTKMFDETGDVDYQVSQLHRLGITPILQAAELGWNAPWSGLWLMWQKHYAFTYHLASRWNVERYNFVNEPDHPNADHDIVNQEVYIRGLQIASDAIRAAIADVNAAYGKRLRAIFQAPVITHASQTSGDYHMDADPDADPRDDLHGWGEICLRNLRTDYHGATVDHDIFDVFDTHQYNKTAETYTYELGMMDRKMREYTPSGTALPVVYSEFNRRNTSAFETSGDDLNTPRIFAELAEIWGAALTGGAEEMICFKFDNTVRANGIPYGTGHYYVENSGNYNVRGVKKAGESNRMFASRFAAANGRDVLAAMVSSTGPAVRPGAIVSSHDTAIGRHSIWLPHYSSEAAYPVTLDLSAAPGRPGGAAVIVQEVSATHSGDVVALDTMPGSGVLTMNQPADCVWLVTLLEQGVPQITDAPTLGVGLTPSASSSSLVVGRAGAGIEPAVSYLAFRVSNTRPRLALLELTGAALDGAPLT